MKRKWIYSLTGIFFLVVVGCMYPPKKFTEKRLVIASKETVRINELDMSITNGGCGRKWINGGERPYCDLVIKTKDSTWHFGDSFDPLYIKNLKLKIDKMNPWGRAEDSVPPGGCRIIVTRLDDLSR
jgi:hypothetical protein